MDKLPHKLIKCTAFPPLVGNGTQIGVVRILTTKLYTKMNAEHELFGELHEQEENGLFGNEHRRQYEAQQEALRLSAVSHRLLRELRQTYLVNVDNDGHPKASITEIMDLWDRVNRELQIVTID